MSMPLGLSIASHSGLPHRGGGALAGAAELAGAALCSLPKGTATRWRCVTRLLPRRGMPGGDRHRQRRTAPAGAGRQDRRAARPGEQRTIHPRPGRRQLGHEQAVGIAPFAPLAMIEEYAAVVRAVLAGSPTGYDGQVFRTGMVPLDSPPRRNRTAHLPGRTRPADARAGRPDCRTGNRPEPHDAGPGRRGRPRCPRVREGGGARSGVGRDRLCNALLSRERRPGRRRGGARRRPALCHASRGAAAVRRTGRRSQPAGGGWSWS